VAIVVLAIVIDSALYYNKVHAGVSVAGVSLAGKTKDEAVAALNAYVAEAEADPITLTSGSESWPLNPTDVGTKVDTEQAVTKAMAAGRDSNFFVNLGHRLKLYFSKQDLPLDATFDDTMLSNFLANIASQLNVPAVNAKLVIQDNQIQTVAGQTGNVVDQSTLQQQLAPLLTDLGSESVKIPIPMMVQQPKVTAQDFQEAVDQSKTMMSAPITLTGNNQSWTLSTDDIVTYMDFRSDVQNGISTLIPYLSADKLTPFFATIADAVATKPQDATFAHDDQKAWVVPGVPGETLDPEATAAALTEAALKTTGRTAEVAVTTAEPNFTTEEAQAYGIQDLLASYSTPAYTGTSNRQVNVRITTQYASNKFLAPGDEYNFDKTIGPRTAERGYKLAPGIIGSGELDDVLGGGICQVSTTLFNAVFEAGLKVTERENHSLYISHYPPGRDATVTAGGKNLRFVNDTDHYIWIVGTSDGVHTNFKIFGTKDGRSVTSSFSGFSYGAARTEVTELNPSLAPGATNVKISGQSGRSCSETRVVTYADGTTHTDVFKSYYPMIPKTIEVGPTTTTTTTKPTTTTTSGTGTTVVTEF
jgi:vancomycin resistance protein YoaR